MQTHFSADSTTPTSTVSSSAATTHTRKRKRVQADIESCNAAARAIFQKTEVDKLQLEITELKKKLEQTQVAMLAEGIHFTCIINVIFL